MKTSKSKELSKKAKEKQKNVLEMLKSHGAKIYEIITKTKTKAK